MSRGAGANLGVVRGEGASQFGSSVLKPHLQDSLGQPGSVRQAAPVFSIRVVFLGEVRLQGSELLAAETRPDSFAPSVDPPSCRPVVQLGLRAAL